ncbi:hypothetical protein Sdiek1_2151 [Sulfurospirillum diekertiae]|uniref:Uncharacterized protein n=1 Tax=Sulfurospirillum diekertiae TaxID=1854492 RepID=A0A1Y0HMG0_9BACT|nr:hypothetical protein Sdiek1_2151 [Sulfurospirillum diekertiae]
MKKWICVLFIFLLGALSLHAEFLEVETQKSTE